MKVLARFYVQQVTRYAHAPGQVSVTLQAVCRGEENKTWAAATPSGQITMNVNNGSAGGWFAERLGKDIAITFEDGGDDTARVSPHEP
jgi:hypothetical protein